MNIVKYYRRPLVEADRKLEPGKLYNVAVDSKNRTVALLDQGKLVVLTFSRHVSPRQASEWVKIKFKSNFFPAYYPRP